MLIANYHTHTFRCGHAKGSDEEYIQAGISLGLKTLGFSDHEEFNNYGNDNVEKKNSITKEYIHSINLLKRKYKEKIDIKLGLEVTYFPFKEERMKYLKKEGITYFILGQHDILDDDGKERYFQFFVLNEKLITRYFNSLITAIKTGHFMYVAHPDLIFANVHNKEISDFMLAESRRFCEEAKKYNIPLELNNNGLTWDVKFKYPNEMFWKIVGEVGNPVVIGLDSHDPIALKETDLSFIDNLINKYKLNVVNTLEIKD